MHAKDVTLWSAIYYYCSSPNFVNVNHSIF